MGAPLEQMSIGPLCLKCFTSTFKTNKYQYFHIPIKNKTSIVESIKEEVKHAKALTFLNVYSIRKLSLQSGRFFPEIKPRHPSNIKRNPSSEITDKPVKNAFSQIHFYHR